MNSRTIITIHRARAMGLTEPVTTSILARAALEGAFDSVIADAAKAGVKACLVLVSGSMDWGNVEVWRVPVAQRVVKKRLRDAPAVSASAYHKARRERFAAEGRCLTCGGERGEDGNDKRCRKCLDQRKTHTATAKRRVGLIGFHYSVRRPQTNRIHA